ncbi:hypothetical protein LZ30DRAFT_735141 [Colletotrichum cereale]|nr:hypothetical protein LZ30DRAFT_735141 [Colletotrichum cereale]
MFRKVRRLLFGIIRIPVSAIVPTRQLAVVGGTWRWVPSVEGFILETSKTEPIHRGHNASLRRGFFFTMGF